MANVKAELSAEISKLRSDLKQASGLLSKFSSSAGKTGKGLGRRMFGGLKAAASVAMAGVKAAFITGAGAAAAAGGIVLAGVMQAAKLESMTVSFEVLTGSTDLAEKTINDLRELGANTPLEFFDLADAGKKLLAFGEEAGNLVPALTRIGDISSGVGAPIGEIAELYGKARVQGTLFAEDINQLTGRGIPVLQEFAKQLGVPVSQVKKLGSEGKLSFANLEKAFVDLSSGSGKFSGMMERQSKTLGGLWSTLKDNITTLLIELGKPIADALRPMMTQAIGLAKTLKDRAAQVGTAIAGAIRLIVAAFQELSSGDLLEILRSTLILAFKSGVNFLYKALVATFKATLRSVAEGFVTLVELLGVMTTADFWVGMWHALRGIAAMFTGALIGAVGEFHSALLKVIPGGVLLKHLGIDPGASMGRVAEGFKEVGADAFAQSGAAFKAPLRAIQDRFQTHMGNVTNEFTTAFKETADVMDASGEKKLLADTAKRIITRAKKSKAESDKAAEEARLSPSGDPGAPIPVAAKAATIPRLAQGVGSLAAAIGSITGSGGRDLVLDEGRKQTSSLKAIEGHLAAIRSDKPKPKSPPLPTPEPVFGI